MNAVIFDCETNGKAKDFRSVMQDLDNWPRVTQLAWQKINIQSGHVLNEYQSIISPDGWTVPTEKFFIDNNMSTERCIAEGKPITEVLDIFVADLKDSDYIVAHNMGFDYNTVGAEMIRHKKSTGKKLKQVCTMQSSTDYCQLPGPYGFKWPRLEELHKHLFGEDMENAHDALADVAACTKCFLRLIELGIITVE